MIATDLRVMSARSAALAEKWCWPRSARPSQPHIERAGAAVVARRLLEAEHDGAKFRRAQPVRREPAQHARLVHPRRRPPFAGDDDRQPVAARLRADEEVAQRLVRLGLGEPVQIEPGVDGAAPAREIAHELALDW